MSEVTQILLQIESGDSSATEKLFPLVYDQLRDLARARISSERADHTLQTTALVHEAYVRLIAFTALIGSAFSLWSGHQASIATRSGLSTKAEAESQAKIADEHAAVSAIAAAEMPKRHEGLILRSRAQSFASTPLVGSDRSLDNFHILTGVLCTRQEENANDSQDKRAEFGRRSQVWLNRLFAIRIMSRP